MFLEDSGVTSYRGLETISCFGMQLIAEPDLGLCDNLKPNRFLGTERKRFFKDLAFARSFIFQGWLLMNLLQQSALAWNELIKYQYLFTYGYKKRLYLIKLTFSLEDYPHSGFPIYERYCPSKLLISKNNRTHSSKQNII